MGCKKEVSPHYHIDHRAVRIVGGEETAGKNVSGDSVTVQVVQQIREQAVGTGSLETHT